MSFNSVINIIIIIIGSSVVIWYSLRGLMDDYKSWNNGICTACGKENWIKSDRIHAYNTYICPSCNKTIFMSYKFIVKRKVRKPESFKYIKLK